jgi:hypothetical protein
VLAQVSIVVSAKLTWNSFPVSDRRCINYDPANYNNIQWRLLAD